MKLRPSGIIGRVLLVLAIIGLLIPVYWLLKSAFSTSAQLAATPPAIFPIPPSLDGFLASLPSLVPSLGVSALIGLGCVAVTLAIACPTAYGLYLLQGQRGGELSQLAVLATLLIPTMLFTIPLYTLLHQFGLLGTVFGLILADCIGTVPLGIIVIFTYYNTLPHALVEAAIIDGAGHPTIFARIAVPLSMPAVATTAILAFLAGWGDYIFAVTFGAGPRLIPASVALANMLGTQTTQTSWPAIMAGSVVLAIPALLAVVFAQRFIAGGLTVGSVKD